ncbi:hypothetical protein [Subtercola boreus]|nr:hypothetical protein [Subtercola boreus]
MFDIRRAHVIAIALAVVINLGVAGVALRVYVFPDTDAPATTDVA